MSRSSAIVSVLLTLGASLVAPAPAVAGTYPMRTCNVPGLPTSHVTPWTWDYAVHTVAFDDCAAGGGFGFAFPNNQLMARVSTAALVLRAPQSGPRSAIRFRLARIWMEARLTGTGSFLYVVTRTRTKSGSAQQTDIFAPPGGSTITAPHVTQSLPQDLSEFEVVVACSGSSLYDCYPAHPRPLEVRGVEFTLEEDVAPSVAVAGGSLMSGADQSGLRTVGYTGYDGESGVAKIEVLLGDTTVGTRDLSKDCDYSDLNACPSASTDEVAADTRLVPDGNYVARLRVTDAAGNRSSAQPPGHVRVRNGSGGQVGERLTAVFTHNGKTRAVARYGRKTRIRGQLTGAGDRPLAGRTIEVSEELTSTRKVVRRRRVTTDQRGRFTHRIATRGPSRRVKLRDVADGGARRTISLRVRALARLRVSLSGVTVRYSGRVVSKPLPRRGKLVLVQGRAPGGRWQTFARRRVGRRGSFSGRYRLRVYRPGVRLQFRARVPPESSFPYLLGTSRIVKKRVR